jgi:hypothetical protein
VLAAEIHATDRPTVTKEGTGRTTTGQKYFEEASLQFNNNSYKCEALMPSNSLRY